MTDPLEVLKVAIKEKTPGSNPAHIKQTLNRAMENFDRIQGLDTQMRPNTERPNFAAQISEGAKSMYNTIISRGGLTATTAIVAVGLFAFLPATRQGFLPLGIGKNDINVEPMILEKSESGGILELGERAAVAELVITADPSVEINTKDMVSASSSEQPINRAANLLARSEPRLLSRPTSISEASSERFANAHDNPLKITSEAPVSTFSIDVDTASYSIARSSIQAGYLPPFEAVRAEEFVNYFSYDYPTPAPDGAPFRPTVAMMPTPWNTGTQLLHIALQGQKPEIESRPPLNLVFLVDTSGSMASDNKLPLLKKSLQLMLNELRPKDDIAIVSYAGRAAVVLNPTPASDHATILAALNGLDSGGSTAGVEGLKTAYKLASQMKEDGEFSRVLLATDGDFNVGISDPKALEAYIANERDSGAYLSVLGFGRGNLDDSTMQALAQTGNGSAAYIDTLSEAQKVLVDQLTGSLFPIANDVKIEVEFNPEKISEYRLIGYETRILNREDFNNDRIDAGEIGAGHRVTAIYEVTPNGSSARLTDPLRYGAGASSVDTPSSKSDEVAHLRIRYKAPNTTTSQLIGVPISAKTLSTPTSEQTFATAIVGFAQLLRKNPYLGDWSFGAAITMAQSSIGDDPFGYRREAITLMRLAESLSP